MTQKELQDIFFYEEGLLYWKEDRGNNKTKGKIAGCLDSHGYRIIRIAGKNYRASRLTYTYHFGEITNNLFIDHIDCNRSNDKIENLRLVTLKENAYNTNKAKGYYFAKTEGKYVAQIKVDGRDLRLGAFKKEEDARNAYLEAKIS